MDRLITRNYEMHLFDKCSRLKHANRRAALTKLHRKTWTYTRPARSHRVVEWTRRRKRHCVAERRQSIDTHSLDSRFVVTFARFFVTTKNLSQKT